MKRAQVKDPDAPEWSQRPDPTAAIPGSILVTRGNFCEVLSQDIGPAKLCLQANGDDLLRLHDAVETDQVLSEHSSFSLSQLLSTSSLTTRMKLVLALTLAHSVWQFYDSDWMRSRWTCESVQFMVEMTSSQARGLHAGKPCLSAKFHDHDDDDGIPEYIDQPNIIHRYPRILALGMLLLEIGRERYVPPTAPKTLSIPARLNRDFTAGKQAEKDKDWPHLGHADTAREQLRHIYKTATMSCFDREIFRNTNLPAQPQINRGSDIELHRAMLYERVVYPLKKVISDMGWDTSLDAIEAIELGHVRNPEPIENVPSETSSSRTNLPSARRNEGPSYLKAALFDDEMPEEGHTPERYVSKFFTPLIRLTGCVIDGRHFWHGKPCSPRHTSIFFQHIS